MEAHPGLADGLTRLAEILENLGIPFCVAGGWAVGMWAAPRATEDIDLLVLLEAGDRERVAVALERGMRLLQSHDAPFPLGIVSVWRNVVFLEGGTEPVVLDFILANHPVLEGMLPRRVRIPFRGFPLPVISLEDLILLKLLSARPQDRLDVEALIASGHPLDRSYLRSAAQRLGASLPGTLLP